MNRDDYGLGLKGVMGFNMANHLRPDDVQETKEQFQVMKADDVLETILGDWG